MRKVLEACHEHGSMCNLHSKDVPGYMSPLLLMQGMDCGNATCINLFSFETPLVGTAEIGEDVGDTIDATTDFVGPGLEEYPFVEILSRTHAKGWVC